jgi:isopenicillin-N N-acyltransferase-like protein
MLGRAEENQLMKELELRGSFFEMGRQYGKGCRKEIWLFSKAVQLMVALSERPGADLFDPQYRHLPREMVLFVKNRKRYRAQAREFIGSLEVHYPEGLEMMRGMAEGAKVDFDDLLFLNTAIELTRGCTSFAAAGDETASGRAVLGMNADEAKGVERTEIVLQIHPDTGHGYTVCGMAGYLPFNFGMNETGLTFMSHLLFLKPGSNVSVGAPMLLYFSVLNRCSTVDEAKALLESLPSCGPGSVVYVADGERFLQMETNFDVRDIEVIDDGIRWSANEPHSAALLPLSAVADMTEANSLFSKNRTQRLQELSDRFSGHLDGESVQSILADHGAPHDDTHMHSMCMHPKHAAGKQTCASMVALPAEKTCWFFEPNPCRNDSKRFAYGQADTASPQRVRAVRTDVTGEVGRA